MVMIRVPTLTDQHRQDHARVLIMACPGCIRRRLPAATGTGSRVPAGVAGGSPDRSAEAAGKRHPLPSPVSVMVAGVASGHGGAQAVAQTAS